MKKFRNILVLMLLTIVMFSGCNNVQETRLMMYEWEYRFVPTPKFHYLPVEEKQAIYQFILMNKMAQPKIVFLKNGEGLIVVKDKMGMPVSSNLFTYETKGTDELTITSADGTVSEYVISDDTKKYKLTLSGDETVNEVLEIYLFRVEDDDTAKEEKKENNDPQA